MAESPAGWYPDHYDPSRERYWNGTEWTDDYRPRSAPPPPEAGSGGWAATPTDPAAYTAGARPHIPNYLAPAILTTLFCCLPFGIVAIVKAAQVNSLAAGGDYEGARRASDDAKRWSWIAFGVGLAAGLIWILVVAGSAGSDFS